LTLSVFITGFAFGQIFYGPLSDRYGRKPVLVIGLTGYIAGSVACFFAQTIEALIIARFFQALGASAAIVLVRAIVRDLYGGEKAARLLSLMGALMGVVPLVAPVLGAVLEVNFGWRASFALTSIIAALLLLASLMFLPETLPPDKKRRWSFFGMLTDFSSLLGHLVYLRYLGAIFLSYGGLFAIISGSSFVFQNHFELNELQFVFAFSVCVTGYIAGTLAGARLSKFHDIESLAFMGTVFLALSGVAMILLSFISDQQVWHLLLPLFVSMVGVGLVMPQSMAGALTPFPQMAGTASSLMGFLQNGFAAFIGIFAAWAITINPNALAWIIGATGLLNFAISLAYRRFKLT
jgi:DHA1 family bicyclomycin/chloramphenicol resistance-like MFS transporter